MTPHINAKEGAFAKTVLMPGDPLRAKFIAETFMDDVQLVTDVRNVLGFTGLYKGKPVSVMASGMGMPSIGIYSYELYSQYGVENIIRIGSAGSYNEDLDVNEVVLAEAAYSDSTFAEVQNGCKEHLLKPGKELNEAILRASDAIGVPCRTCIVHSSDVFYSNKESWQEIKARTGTDCVEMESFALFHNANVLGKNAACILTISDSFVSHKELTSEERQKSFTNMMKLALETAISLVS